MTTETTGTAGAETGEEPTPAEIQHTEDYAVEEAHAVDHLTPRQYWLIALFLGVVTAIEVAIAYIDALDFILVPALLILGLVKFVTVVGYFMHLKFDNPTFTRLFAVGAAGAIVLFMAVLLSFHAVF